MQLNKIPFYLVIIGEERRLENQNDNSPLGRIQAHVELKLQTHTTENKSSDPKKEKEK